MFVYQRNLFGHRTNEIPNLVNVNIANWEITFFFIGKSTISMVIFHSYVSLPEGKQMKYDWSISDEPFSMYLVYCTVYLTIRFMYVMYSLIEYWEDLRSAICLVVRFNDLQCILCIVRTRPYVLSWDNNRKQIVDQGIDLDDLLAMDPPCLSDVQKSA